MGLDARIKSLFPAILAAFVIIVAYFQAKALGHLVAAHLELASLPAPPPLQARASESDTLPERATDGSAILARNPFDSITGPLKAPSDSATASEAPVANNADPYSDPVCDAARVMLITTADDPSWSFAAIAAGNSKATLRRIGDEVAGHVVAGMTWDRVWLTKGGSRCQIPIHQGLASAAPPSMPMPMSPPPPRPGRSRYALPPEIAEKIRKISDTQFEVDRSVLTTVMERQGEFLRSVRVIPTQTPNGSSLRMVGIRPDSLLGSIGLNNGDQLMTINNFDMSDPQSALQAYSRLQNADKLDVKVIRGGQPMNIEINMR
ncbi:MAG: general secretion pathway protein GspC [Polyangiaceae bacterium]|nr:general secretion pathway protein GspC [Polyangiaceae bacterium]